MSNMTCRLCSAKDVRLHNIKNTEFQKVYETLTSIPLVSGTRSHMACYICRATLQKIHRLQQQCIVSNKVFKQLFEKCSVEVKRKDCVRKDKKCQLTTHFLLGKSLVELTDYGASDSLANKGIIQEIKKETIDIDDQSSWDAIEAANPEDNVILECIKEEETNIEIEVPSQSDTVTASSPSKKRRKVKM